MNKVVIYIHGKNGSAEEAAHYKSLFADCDVIGFDYCAQSPWEAKEEFPKYFESTCESYDSVVVIANSIGAYFTMAALSSSNIEQVFFISPIVDMEKLIADMMTWESVTEDNLRNRKEIQTHF